MQCPVCRAENSAGPSCRRCKADLSLLMQIDTQRQQCMALAWHHAGCGSTVDALAAATQAHECRADADSWRLLALTHLLNRDFASALKCYQAAMASGAA